MKPPLRYHKKKGLFYGGLSVFVSTGQADYLLFNVYFPGYPKAIASKAPSPNR